jgi:hypothetical protein
MSNIDSVREFENAWGQVRERLVEQEERIAALERENEKLREERDSMWTLCGQILRDEVSRNEAAWEAEIRQAMQNGVPFEEVMREVEAVLDRSLSERQHG